MYNSLVETIIFDSASASYRTKYQCGAQSINVSPSNQVFIISEYRTEAKIKIRGEIVKKGGERLICRASPLPDVQNIK